MDQDPRIGTFLGQFTQTDPIGIAGGLNTYGYAGGDPINFSDPFGLCPWCVGALVGFGFEAVSQLASRDLNGEALGAAFVIGGASGGLSVGSKVAKFGLQAGLSVADGLVRSQLTGEDYGGVDALLDAGAGFVGEGVGNAARGFASSTSTQLGRSIAHLESGQSTMTPNAQKGFRAILDNRLGQLEGAVAGAASGLTSRLGAIFGDDENR